jgi:hypothetical protein
MKLLTRARTLTSAATIQPHLHLIPLKEAPDESPVSGNAAAGCDAGRSVADFFRSLAVP